jgi:hypothetical protein
MLLRFVVGGADRERIHRLVRDDDAGGLAHRDPPVLAGPQREPRPS